MKFSPVRDIVSGVIGAASGGVGLLGTAAKKFFIAKDDSLTKKVLVGIGIAVVTGGTALLPYMIAGPGKESKAEVAAARGGIVDGRY
jgi:hypothetical protein